MKSIGKTPGIRALDDAGVSYRLRPYNYRGGGEIGLEAAAALNINPSLLFKAVVLEGPCGAVLAAVPSDRRVAPGKLMKALGQSARAEPVAPVRAQSLTGYLVGGISVLGLRHVSTICIDASALSRDLVYVNAGRRGLMVELSPRDLLAVANAVCADIVEDIAVSAKK